MTVSNRRFALIAAAVAMSLSGCQVMSEKECRSADWHEVGYQDGRYGRERARIEDIAEACAKANVAPDRVRYFAGREIGLQEYCTPENGFLLGKNGGSMSQVCPPESVGGFEASYYKGRRIYDARQQIERLESKRHKYEEQLSKARTDDERKHARDELREIDQELNFARDALRFVESQTLR